MIDLQVLGGGDREHAINSKKVDVKRARAKPGTVNLPLSELFQSTFLGKIFCGGLTTDLSDEEIRNYFSQFGSVTDCEMPFDKSKNQRKNFCFITFEREETMKEVLKLPKQKIGEVEVDVKKATPKIGKQNRPNISFTDVSARQVTEVEATEARWITTTATLITTAGGRCLAKESRGGRRGPANREELIEALRTKFTTSVKL